MRILLVAVIHLTFSGLILAQSICDPSGNLIIYSNYDGGILTINVDQNIPNLKVGISTYEPIQVNFTGPFVANITQVVYAGMNSNQNNNNCGLGNFPTSVTGLASSLVTINPPMDPPQVGYTPVHGNGASGGSLFGCYNCDTLNSAGGLATADEVVYYFQTATGGTMRYHQTQYGCWSNQTLNISTGGNCCIVPSSSNPCSGIISPTFSQVSPVCAGGTFTLPTTSTNGITGNWSPPINNSATTTYTFTPATGQCANTATMTVDIIDCSSSICDPAGNLIIYSNYDGGILTINVDQNIPNLKVGISTYEPIQVNFTGPFVANITQVVYAGMNSNQNNNNCGLGNFPTSVTGVASSLVTINPPMDPPQVGYTPVHGNGAGAWGGNLMGSYSCDTLNSTGGTATADEVVYYFQTATGGTMRYHQTQYTCWTNETLNISNGGNCCIVPSVSNPCSTTVSPTFTQITPVCSGSSIILPTNSTNGITGTWSPSINNMATTTYTFTPTAGQCATTATMSVVVNSNVLPIFSQLSPICIGGMITLPNTSTNGISGSWSPAINNTATTTYTFTATSGQCVQTATMSVVVNSIVTPSFTQVSPICSGEMITLPTTSINGVSGSWSPSINNTATTTYTFTPTSGQCAQTTTMSVVVNSEIVPVFTQQGPLCSGTPITLPNTSTNGITGTWSPPINNSTTTTYTFTPAAGFCASEESLTVEIYPSTIISVVPTSATIDEGDSIQLTATGAGTYSWTNVSSLSCVNCANPFANPESTTTYVVTGTDANGCESSQTVTIFVNVICNELFVPTIFSPNAQGLTVNESLCVLGNCIASLQFEVFNRWGEKVFETNDTELCWDGSYKNKPCQSGVYVYKLVVTKTNGQTFVQSGNITLIK